MCLKKWKEKKLKQIKCKTIKNELMAQKAKNKNLILDIRKTSSNSTPAYRVRDIGFDFHLRAKFFGLNGL